MKGEPPPPTLKVSLNSIGGFRNEMTFVLTGLDIEAKAELVRRQLEAGLTVKPAELEWTLTRTDHSDAETEETASALLRCVVRDPDPANVGRQFSSAAVELALASYPGFTTTAPPGEGQVYGVFTPGYVDAAAVPHVAVHDDGSRTEISAATDTRELLPVPPFALPEPLPFGETRRVPLGTIAGARSGDKGGNANVGVWVRKTSNGGGWRAMTVESCAKCCRRQPISRSPATCCPTCGRPTSLSRASSAREWPTRPASTHRPRASANGCAADTSISRRR